MMISGLVCLVLFCGLCECKSMGILDLNETAKNDSQNHHDIHVASWQYSEVGKPLLITLFIVAMCVTKILLHHARRLEALIPESCLLIVLGIGIGLLFLIEGAESELHFLYFEHRSFFFYMLPPIILEAAYSLKDRAFAENLGTIVLYAVLGTILNVFIVGPALFGFYVIGFMGPSLTLTFLECLIFSAVVAAVDPVAVLAIFEEIGVNKMLYFMVFGESLFNDAVTVVVYNMIQSFMQIEHIGIREFGLGLAAFMCVALGGMVIGLICGFLTAFITKYSTKMRVIEPAIFYGVAYLAYIGAELVHFSGIISIICCGLIQSYYASENISSKSYITIFHFSKVMSGISESLIFIILGVMMINNGKAWLNINPSFTVLALIMCLVARFLVVFLLAYIVNSVVVSVRKIRMQEQFIMAYGGLRGAVTFALVFMLDPKILKQDEKTKDVLLCAAYVIIIFTTFLQGISIKPLVKLMRIRLETKETSCLKEITTAMMDNAMAGLEEIIGHHGSHWLTATTHHLSDKFIRPAVQKFPDRNHSYSSFLAAYQEAHMKEQFALTHAYWDLPTQEALFSECDNNDNHRIPHNVTAVELECQDEIVQDVRKQQRQVGRKEKPKPPPLILKLEKPEDMLALRDILQTPPHKTVHYLFDRTDGEERHHTILNQIRHGSQMRRRSRAAIGKKHKIKKDFNIPNVVLESALLPLGITLIKKGSGSSMRRMSIGAGKRNGMRRSVTSEGLVNYAKYMTGGTPNQTEQNPDKKVSFSLGEKEQDEPMESDTLLDHKCKEC